MRHNGGSPRRLPQLVACMCVLACAPPACFATAAAGSSAGAAWDPDVWQRSRAAVPPSSIKKVHVVQSCHLDVGFVDLAVNIVNRYFDTVRDLPGRLSGLSVLP